MIEAELIAWGARVGHPPIAAGFMPEMHTEVCSVTGDEIRIATTYTAGGRKVQDSYLLSMPEMEGGRVDQDQGDRKLRATVWFLARNLERFEAKEAA